MFILCVGRSLAYSLVVYVHYGKDEGLQHYAELQDTLHDMGIDMLACPINEDRTIEENALHIDSVIANCKNNNDSMEVILMSEKMSSFVAIDVLAKDTSIIAWIALSGVFCDGDDCLYNEASVRVNTEMLDSVSFDNRKEKCLSGIYKMIESAKEEKKPVLPRGADDYMRKLHSWLNNRYGRSFVSFSPASYMGRVSSWIIPLCDNSKHESELFLNTAKLVHLRSKYNNIKIMRPVPYYDSSLNSRIVEQVSNLLKE